MCVGLLANTVDQQMNIQLTHRIREQARSHKKPVSQLEHQRPIGHHPPALSRTIQPQPTLL